MIGFKPLIYNNVYPLKKKVINNGINKKGIKNEEQRFDIRLLLVMI